MTSYLFFCIGVAVGSIVSLFYIKKLLVQEFESKYGADIESYKKIICDFNNEVDSLEEENASLREQLSVIDENSVEAC